MVTYAASTGQSIRDLARAVTDGTLPSSTLVTD
jgi:hypothetical protein